MSLNSHPSRQQDYYKSNQNPEYNKTHYFNEIPVVESQANSFGINNDRQLPKDSNLHKPKIVIVGAGPSGLTLAHYLSKYTDSQITVIDREQTIGGCHRVRRIKNAEKPGELGYFTEHGPRIYNSNYLNFRRILQEDLKADFYKFFKPYDFSMTSIGGQGISHFSAKELFLLLLEFLKLPFSKSSQKQTVLEFAQKHHFSPESIDYLDRVCRLSDGAGADRYTLFEFLQLPNQHGLYKIYQPTKANDLQLLPLWQEYLERRGVKFILGAEVQQLVPEAHGQQIAGLRYVSQSQTQKSVQELSATKISELEVNTADWTSPAGFDNRTPQEWTSPAGFDNRTPQEWTPEAAQEVINLKRRQDTQSQQSQQNPDASKAKLEVTYKAADVLILAIPPEHLVDLLNRSRLSRSFQPEQPNLSLSDWARYTSYFTYVPMTFHYQNKIKLPSKWGFSQSDWGVVWIVLSDYFKDYPGTLITIAITRTNGYSKALGRTSNQSNKDELISETYRQMTESFPGLPRPDRAIVSPGVYRNSNENSWKTKDQSFVLTTEGYLPAESDTFNNLYSLGCHNGKSPYYFTSMESAVANAIDLTHKLLPETKYKVPILKPISITDVILIIGLLMTIYYVFRKMRK